MGRAARGAARVIEVGAQQRFERGLELAWAEVDRP